MSNLKPKMIRRVVFLSIILALAVLMFTEGAARLFLYFTRGRSTVGMAEKRKYLHYRPFVMFGPDWDKVLSASAYRKTEGSYRILLLGGSTAAHFPKAILEEAFRKKFPDRKFEVINAARGGYNARQEAIVCALWAPGLKPDMIITLDGANDMTHRLIMNQAGTFYLDSAYEMALKRPLMAPLQHLLRHSQLLNGLRRLHERAALRPWLEYSDAVPVYISSQHSIDCIAKGLGAKRILVLQPFLAFKEPMSKPESNFKCYEYRESVIKRLYDLTDKSLEALARKDGVLYCGGKGVFNGIKDTVFSDDFHFVNDNGYRLLAERIASLVTESDFKKGVTTQ